MLKKWIISIIVVAALLTWYNHFKSSGSVAIQDVSYSDFLKKVEQHEFEHVSVYKGTGEVLGRTKGKLQIKSIGLLGDPELFSVLHKSEVEIDLMPQEGESMLPMFFWTFGPVLLIILVWLFISKKSMGGKGNLMSSFNKSKAGHGVLSEDNKVRLLDVAGCDEAKGEIGEIVDFLKSPEKYKKLGGRSPRGVLMSGPPGTGKTLLAKAIAGEAGVPFFFASGSDFVEMFVGVGASRVREMFERAKKAAPSIIFIDEIDAVGRKRGSGSGGSNDEREQTLNALLVEMDGFLENQSVIVIAATNRPDVLDQALLRPGRFDRDVSINLPDIKGRVQILSVHAKDIPFGADVDFQVIARGTPGFSGADLANLINEATIIASRENKDEVHADDFDKAKDKIVMGVERKGMYLPEKERRNTAYHEAGHAVVAYLLPNADPLHKVTIIPRGRAMGVTMQIPLEDKYGYNYQDLLTNIQVLMGGRVAEEIFLNTKTTGASNDIERATSLAKKIVMDWGMSDLGPIHYGEGSAFGEALTGAFLSETTRHAVSTEVEKCLKEQYEAVRVLLKNNMEMVEQLTQELLDKETVGIEELVALWGPRSTEEIEDRSSIKNT